VFLETVLFTWSVERTYIKSKNKSQNTYDKTTLQHVMYGVGKNDAKRGCINFRENVNLQFSKRGPQRIRS